MSNLIRKEHTRRQSQPRPIFSPVDILCDATALEDTIANAAGVGHCAMVREDFPGKVIF